VSTRLINAVTRRLAQAQRQPGNGRLYARIVLQDVPRLLAALQTTEDAASSFRGELERVLAASHALLRAEEDRTERAIRIAVHLEQEAAERDRLNLVSER